MTFLRSVFLLKLCSKECLGFRGEIMMFGNMTQSAEEKKRKKKKRRSAVGVTLQTETLLQSSTRGMKIRVEKGAIGELNSNLGEKK